MAIYPHHSHHVTKMTNTTELTIWRTDLEFYEGITQEQIDADDFDWFDHESDNDTSIEMVATADGELVYERKGGDSSLFNNFTGAVRLMALKEFIEIEHSGDFDATKLDCSGDHVIYDGEELEADSSAVKSEDVIICVDGKPVE